MKTTFVAIILLISLNLHTPAQEVVASHTGLEVAEFRTIPILVETPSQRAQEIGLTREMIAARTNLELRKHDLKGIDAEDNKAKDRYLYVVVNVSGSAFSIQLAFSRRVTFVSGKTTYSVFGHTWSRVATGGLPRGSESALDTLADGLQLFMSDYLKTNDK